MLNPTPFKAKVDIFKKKTLRLPWRRLAVLPWRRVVEASAAALQRDGLGQSSLLAQLQLQLLRKQTHKPPMTRTGFPPTAVAPQKKGVAPRPVTLSQRRRRHGTDVTSAVGQRPLVGGGHSHTHKD